MLLGLTTLAVVKADTDGCYSYASLSDCEAGKNPLELDAYMGRCEDNYSASSAADGTVTIRKHNETDT